MAQPAAQQRVRSLAPPPAMPGKVPRSAPRPVRLVAGVRRKQVEGQAAQQGAAQANAQAAELMNTFKKGMAACLEGKGYTVK